MLTNILLSTTGGSPRHGSRSQNSCKLVPETTCDIRLGSHAHSFLPCRRRMARRQAEKVSSSQSSCISQASGGVSSECRNVSWWFRRPLHLPHHTGKSPWQTFASLSVFVITAEALESRRIFSCRIVPARSWLFSSLLCNIARLHETSNIWMNVSFDPCRDHDKNVLLAGYYGRPSHDSCEFLVMNTECWILPYPFFILCCIMLWKMIQSYCLPNVAHLTWQIVSNIRQL